MTSHPVLMARIAIALAAGTTIALTAGANAQLPLARSVSSGSRQRTDTVWTIEKGSYAGLTVPVHIEAAIGGPGRSEHFWRGAKAGLPTGVVGWKSTRYPIPVAFRHDGFSHAISPNDSAAFWLILGEMSKDFGMDLFSPSTVANDDPPDVIVVDLRLMTNIAGLSRATWTQSGELFDVRVTFQAAAMLRDPHVVTHEMMHALGFGHTTAWASVVDPRPAGGAQRVTAEDVAYGELAMHSRVTRERVVTRDLIALAVARETHSKDDESYGPCASSTGNDILAEDPTMLRATTPPSIITVVSSCAQ